MMSRVIQEAFAERPHLLQSVVAAASSNAQTKTVFEEVATYVMELRSQIQVIATTNSLDLRDEPAAKKRRLNGSAQEAVDSPSMPADFLTATWRAPTIEVSFTIPQRKKYLLQVSTERDQGIRVLGTSNKTPEFGIPWKFVDNVLRLPVPDKATASHNFCVFPKGVDGFSPDGPNGNAGFETMVWSTSDVRKKGEESNPTESDLLMQIFKLARFSPEGIVEPSENEFASVYKNPVRKTEQQYHVKAFRGSKEGYLFFLENGIAFVFKKPLIFFQFSAIHSISYTSVLQHTFNLNVSAVPASSATGEPVEIEFSMLDQADFPAIDAYIKRHKLNDASMAEARKAKKYNVNKDRKTEGEEGTGEESELTKAEKEAEQIPDDDEDDEDDENFDPGSEGESEGEGQSSDDDEDDDDDNREDAEADPDQSEE